MANAMKAFLFKEFRLFTSLNRMCWVSLIFPVIISLNPLFLHTGDALFKAMIDAPTFGLFLAITVDYTTWQDYLDGVPELIVQSGTSFRTYLLTKLWMYEAATTVFLVISLLAALHADRGALPAPGMVAAQLLMACLMNWAWTALDTQLAMFLRLLMPNTAFLLTACILMIPMFASIVLWALPFVTAALISLAIVLLCAVGAFLLSLTVLQRRYASTLGDLGTIAPPIVQSL
ncbi:hypothetical protein [uncultured Bifidobacterium sp.]|uniref:hypothetical protein n=1 Tax=uncultured Bifidobacterium sp. TaxID=165187 RepID=UPI002592AD91|nr:hypothetical protein [uncultured Bifidobacterium sp.]